MTKKQYAKITEQAESRIHQFMERAKKEEENFLKWAYKNRAYGVFVLWDDMTSGWQKEGDKERLEKATEEEF